MRGALETGHRNIIIARKRLAQNRATPSTARTIEGAYYRTIEE